MNEEEIKKLTEKYYAGKSSQKEEKVLFDQYRSTNPVLDTWSSYADSVKKEVPADLSDNIWKAISNKKKRKHRLLFSYSVAATVIAILAITSILGTFQKSMNTTEKAAVLREALSLFPDSNQSMKKPRVFYEDELIIIYTTEKQPISE